MQTEGSNGRRTSRRLVLALWAFILVVSACGGGGDAVETGADANTLDAGSFRVQLPDEITVVDDTAQPTAPPDAASGESAAGEQSAPDASGETAVATSTPDPDEIPLEDDSNAVSALFDAFDSFGSCLERVGTVFAGIPDPSVPETMDEKYIADLTTCAAESNIQQALADAESASADRTPEETELFNVGFLIFVDCMRGKGWTIDEPQPDQNGALQIALGDGFVPPPGEDFIGNPNVRECGAQATREAEALADAQSE